MQFVNSYTTGEEIHSYQIGKRKERTPNKKNQQQHCLHSPCTSCSCSRAPGMASVPGGNSQTPFGLKAGLLKPPQNIPTQHPLWNNPSKPLQAPKNVTSVPLHKPLSFSKHIPTGNLALEQCLPPGHKDSATSVTSCHGYNTTLQPCTRESWALTNSTAQLFSPAICIIPKYKQERENIQGLCEYKARTCTTERLNTVRVNKRQFKLSNSWVER